MLGAGAIVTGSLVNLGDVQRLNIKSIDVETAKIAASYAGDIANSARVKALLASDGTAPAASSAKPMTPVVDPPTTPVQATVPQNGTYTFYPRLRANQGGVDKDVYLDRIIIRNNYLTVYLVDTPIGKTNYYDPERKWGGNTQRSTVLKDLNSNLTWNVANIGRDSITNGFYITFLKVTASRFSLANNNPYPPMIFDEIVMDKPD
jgi:hypothetical protein